MSSTQQTRKQSTSWSLVPCSCCPRPCCLQQRPAASSNTGYAATDRARAQAKMLITACEMATAIEQLQSLEATAAADRDAIISVRDARDTAETLGRLCDSDCLRTAQWSQLWAAQVQTELQTHGSPFDIPDEGTSHGSVASAALPVSVVLASAITDSTSQALQGSGTLVVLVAPVAASVASTVLSASSHGAATARAAVEIQIEKTAAAARQAAAVLPAVQPRLVVEADMGQWPVKELQQRYQDICAAISAAEAQRHKGEFSPATTTLNLDRLDPSWVERPARAQNFVFS